MRSRVLGVLSQLSSMSHIRSNLRRDFSSVDEADLRIELASLVFYYLFEDWRSTYGNIVRIRRDLGDLVRALFIYEKLGR